MTTDVLARLAESRIVPVVTLDNPAQAVPLADALVDGGIPVVEITLRSEAGVKAIGEIAGRGDLLVGAGTVLNATQVDQAVLAGAQFIVSPGYGHDVVARAADHGVPVFPGIATASELQAAVNAGLTAVKFFPTEQLGGIAMLSSLAAAFPNVSFLPSGGITAQNATEYLTHPAVFAVGGSWMAPPASIAADDFDTIRQLSAEAMTRIEEL
ncbi:2-dehydro-3-deoxy-phosphogluconate aldolase [Arthrobacter tecti]